MASSSLGSACGGNSPNFIQKRCGVSLLPPCFVEMARSTGRIPAAAMSMEQERRMSVVERKRERGGGHDAVEGQERLDRWIRESVVEIVKNLREAPLLVQVHPKSGTTMTSTETKVMVEDWPAVKEKWENGETPVPEGVIFVEELSDDETMEEHGGERTTRVWGVVVQGKGVGCGPVCYLLKTSRVGSGPGPGMGICSTYFCLVKVKDFRETMQSQLKNCWLLQSRCRWQQ